MFGSVLQRAVAVTALLASLDSDTFCHCSPLKSNATSRACNLLESYQSTEVATSSQNSTAYTTEREGHWSPTAWDYPSCIFQPSSIQDVVTAIRILRETGADFAIRSGGHSPLPNWASIDDGVLISMSNFKDLAYDPVAQTARIGMGNRWGNVNDFLEPFNRLVVAGRVAEVGAALVPGGGLSHLSNRYGFAVDNVVSYEIVLANATAVTASATSYPDLFYGLKGGSNNFGVIHHMTLKTHPVSKVWGGLIVYNDTYQDQLMEAFASYQAKGQLDKDSAMLTYLVPTNGTVFATYVHFGNESRPAAFADFYAIPSVADETALFDNFSSLLNHDTINYAVSRWNWATTTIYLDSETYVDAARICADASKQLASINGGTFAIMPQPISKSMIEAANSSTPNALGLQDRPQLWFSLNIGWNLAADDAKVQQILIETLARVEVLTKSRGVYGPFTFLNDAGDFQDPIASYGQASLNKMRSASCKYDPKGTFQYQVPGGFKLWPHGEHRQCL